MTGLFNKHIYNIRSSTYLMFISSLMCVDCHCMVYWSPDQTIHRDDFTVFFPTIVVHCTITSFEWIQKTEFLICNENSSKNLSWNPCIFIMSILNIRLKHISIKERLKHRTKFNKFSTHSSLYIYVHRFHEYRTSGNPFWIISSRINSDLWTSQHQVKVI